MPENEKSTLGTWETDAVTDIFGDDKWGEIPADALTVEINANQTAHVTITAKILVQMTGS